MEHQSSRASRPATIATLLVTVAALVLTVMTMVAPTAGAHPGPDFEHDDVVRGETCPEGTVSNGSPPIEIFGTIYSGCTHPGFSPIGDNVELCDAAGGRIIGGYCTFDRARECGTRPDFRTEIGGGLCVRPALARDELFPEEPRLRLLVSAVPICAETELAQEQGQALSIGGTFWSGGVQYMVVTGDSCAVNCLDGWDFNCDGRIGDFCKSEYDLGWVADIGWCMADYGMAPTS